MPCGVCGADASARKLGAHDRAAFAERIHVDFKPLPIDAEAVFRLVDRMQRRIGLHEILDIFLLRDRLFRLPRARVRVALFSVEIQIFLPVFLLADAADDVRLRPDEIGLHHIDRAGGIRLLKRRTSGMAIRYLCQTSCGAVNPRQS